MGLDAVVVPVLVASCILLFVAVMRPHGRGMVICLGSGGHTTEMLYLVNNVELRDFKVRNYYISSGDALSLSKARQFESGRGLKGAKYRTVFRARRVKQSWITTPWTAMVSMLDCLRLMLLDQPKLVMVNGPGTCVMIILAARILSFFRINAPCKVIFVESFARVTRLSLSGRIILRLNLADRFLVMWKELADRYEGTEYVGVIV